jgi:transcription elongation factor Elf1
MIQQSLKPEITGTRTGYVIRFTCPVCCTENAIVNKTPREHFRDARDATCKQCRKRFKVLTPGTNDTPARPYVQSYFECTKLQ